jgi:hypothetical protein
MLASITPLGERGRHSRWGVTVTAFVLGAVAAGASVGALAGAVGSLAFEGVGARIRLVALAAAALVALALDSARRVPGPRRQVDERWLDRYRGWVYGLGYGAQLGVGVATVVSSAATYVAIGAALLSSDALRGAVVMGSYGLVRGLSLTVAARVRTPQQLFALHSSLERGRGLARRGGALALAAIAAGALL